MSVTRREFLAGSLALGGSACLQGAEAAPRHRRILLRSSWQSVNIGDVGHTPGVLRLIERYLPQAEVTLWAPGLNQDAEAMLRRNFPRVNIIKGGRLRESQFDAAGLPRNEQIRAEWERMDLFLHGSAPYIVVPEEMAACRKLGKPYGAYGVSIGEVDEELKQTLSGASFVFCRDTHSLAHLKECGVSCPVMEFGPDGAFALDVRDEARALAYMERHGLEERRFLCAVPRLRYTPPKAPARTEAEAQEHRRRAEVSERYAESDHAKLRHAITAWVRQTGGKVLVCPEMTYQIEVGKRLLVDPLPEDVKAHVVHRDTFWMPDEAASVYARARAVVSFEMHSPIISAAAGTPTVHLRQPTDTRKGQMIRDIGLSEWLFEMDEATGEEIAATLLEIHRDHPAALAKLHQAMAFVAQRQRDTMAVVGKVAGIA